MFRLQVEASGTTTTAFQQLSANTALPYDLVDPNPTQSVDAVFTPGKVTVELPSSMRTPSGAPGPIVFTERQAQLFLPIGIYTCQPDDPSTPFASVDTLLPVPALSLPGGLALGLGFLGSAVLALRRRSREPAADAPWLLRQDAPGGGASRWSDEKRRTAPLPPGRVGTGASAPTEAQLDRTVLIRRPETQLLPIRIAQP